MADAPPRPRGVASGTAALALLVLLAVAAPRCRVARAQQGYEANAQDDCYGRNDSTVLGYTCNATAAAAAPCASYLVFRSSPPFYQSPVSISFLLNLSPSAVADANAVPTVSPVAASQLVLAPVPCRCAPRGYYQHNASYTIISSNETYFIIANITYQGLSTCQALMAQNPTLDSRHLLKDNNLTVPIRCACPSPAQAAAGVRHLLTYLVDWGDSVAAIADRFRVDAQAVLDANSITETDSIFPFTTLLIPLKNAPTPDMLVSPAPPPAPSPPQAQPPPSSGGSSSGVAVGVGVGVGALALAVLLALIFFFVRRRRRRRTQSVDGENGGRPGKVMAMDVPSSSDYDPLASGKHTTGTATTSSSSSSALVSGDARAAAEAMTLYKYPDLDKATAGFAEERRIANSSVYRAVINGDAAAVKRVAGDVSGEVGILKRVNHSSLVRLSGLCVHRGDTYLVFEFAENGALSDWLHGAGVGGATLVWKQRVQAAFDIADGLNYLHHYTNPPCVHKNLKSSNVLLDAGLRAKVSSFALARSVPEGADGAQLTRHVVGTQGYLAPEYLEHGLITPKLDVFAFGVILLELLSGKEATFDGGDKRGETLLWESAEGLVVQGEDARGKVREFMDPRLHGDYPLDLAVAVASLALRCVAREPRGRPSMDEVFVKLSAVYNSMLDWDPSDYGNSRSSIAGR
ncbi:protein LYK5-like [Lolium rigidum]|uniref:protein LYK5-like n=1 Tax=Lolium rigidum TaxID=89674 RepID=UPI001F5CB0FF|nr:protein LYK5-like [Lolium rigidum]